LATAAASCFDICPPVAFAAGAAEVAFGVSAFSAFSAFSSVTSSFSSTAGGGGSAFSVSTSPATEYSPSTTGSSQSE
jgi:hypothetical protein